METHRWVCQSCNHPFVISGADTLDRVSGLGTPSAPGSGSVKMDQSYVMLPKQRNPGYPPPRPRNSGVNIQKDFKTTQSHRSMDESYVVLPNAAASIYKSDTHSSGASGTTNASFNSSVNALTRVFQIAATQTQVDQPLCVECMLLLSEELDKEIEETEMDIKEYKACLDRLEKQQSGMSEDEFSKEMSKIEAEVKKLEAEIERVDKENMQQMTELEILDLRIKTFETLEQSFWHDVNDFKMNVDNHREEGDAVLAKIDVAQAQLTLLKKATVLKDAFHIAPEGDLATINNLRLSYFNSQVEWDEINAAWGQACLLLHTMARYCPRNFTYRIIPMGSYSSITDSKNTYELYGPVNVFWSSKYDKAKVYFLACLQELADYAHAKDIAANKTKPFKLPYKIEHDKVNGLPIARTINQQENSTTVLKYTLCNLNWILHWFNASTAFRPASSIGNINGSSC